MVVASAGMLLTACAGSQNGGSSSSSASASSSSAAPAPTSSSAPAPTSSSAPAPESCGDKPVEISEHAWVGYAANVAVFDYVLKNVLKCTTNITKIDENTAWQGFETGSTDIILENWGHPELVKKYIDEKKVAVDLGPTGNQGIIGWYVPKWMADTYPEITNWESLKDPKFVDMFKTTESGDLGQLLDGDPSYVTNDEALVKNLDLPYKVVFSGSEDALISALKKATENKTPLLFYFYEPHYILAEYPVAHVKLPPYTPGCDNEAEKVACDYPPYTLNKIGNAEWVAAGGPAVNFAKKFNWTNEDQNEVAAAIQGGATYDEAAKAWVDAHADIVAGWTS